MTAHSLLGASAAHRWLNCPGSFALSRTAPHRKPSIYAATGSLAHEFIERCWHDSRASINAEIGKTFTLDGYEIPVDQDLADGVNLMLGYLRSTSFDWIEIEQQVSLKSYFRSTPPVPVFGTLDAAGWTDATHTLEIVDYKNGSKIVSPVENPQLMFYAAGALPLAPDVRHLKLTIVQPHAGSAPIRSWELAPVDLQMWIDDVLVPGVDACTQPDAPLVPGSWCHFCPVSHACPVLHAAAVDLAKHEFDDYPDDAGDLAQTLDTAERAELWIAGLRKFAQEQLERQISIPGWGLVPTRPSRKWTRPDDDIATILSGAGLGPELWETRLRSPAQLEKVLAKTRAGKRLWRDVIEDQRLFDARSSGVKIGRTTDPRDAFEDYEP